MVTGRRDGSQVVRVREWEGGVEVKRPGRQETGGQPRGGGSLDSVLSGSSAPWPGPATGMQVKGPPSNGPGKRCGWGGGGRVGLPCARQSRRMTNGKQWPHNDATSQRPLADDCLPRRVRLDDF